MSKKHQIYLDAAIAGYSAGADAKSPHIATSPIDMAWQTGRWLRTTGRAAPRLVFPSRGYTMNVNEMRVRLKYSRTGLSIDHVT